MTSRASPELLRRLDQREGEREAAPAEPAERALC